MQKITRLVFLLVLLGLWILWGNSSPVLTEYTISSRKIPVSFSGMKIAQISDLHNDTLGNDNHRILTLLKKAAPDIIVITGDLVDCRSTNIGVASAFVRKVTEIAPCFYVTGNHETSLSADDYDTLMADLADAGVILLDNRTVLLSQEEDFITLTGVWRPSAQLALPNSDTFHMLLIHNPVSFPRYAKIGFDLVFAGHTHGGQIRLPFLGGLYTPDQGFLPEYDAGLYHSGSSQLLISRGLGNSKFPLRIFNRPEVILVRLSAEKSS